MVVGKHDIMSCTSAACHGVSSGRPIKHDTDLECPTRLHGHAMTDLRVNWAHAERVNAAPRITACRGRAFVTYSSAAVSPLAMRWPHSARKFHRATPAVLGLAVMTSTSGLCQSDGLIRAVSTQLHRHAMFMLHIAHTKKLALSPNMITVCPLLRRMPNANNRGSWEPAGWGHQ